MLLQPSMLLALLVPLLVLCGAVLGAIAYSEPVSAEVQSVTTSLSNLVFEVLQ
jgi:hypothetical protein